MQSERKYELLVDLAKEMLSSLIVASGCTWESEGHSVADYNQRFKRLTDPDDPCDDLQEIRSELSKGMRCLNPKSKVGLESQVESS